MASSSSSSTTTKTVTVSAPGKVLLVGGYLVLERPNVGCVVAANSRFYTTVQASTQPHIHVSSPQYRCHWKFDYNQGNLSASPENCSINPFVEKTLRVCLLYLVPPSTPQVSLEITIQADNEFYSVLPHLQERNQPRTLEAVAALPKFLACPMDPQNPGNALVNKTGLGSSAALTTSLVGALVHYFAPPDQVNVTMIHNLAQICHCHAQGKVGSGFDVSAACYGTHVYRRFPKTLLPDLLGQLEHEEATNSHLLNARGTIENLAEDEWEDDMVEPLSLILSKNGGHQLQILLADVRGGTESPGMAKTVLNWKQSKRPPIPHWDDLKQLNLKVVSLMHSLSSTSKENAESVDYDALAALPASQWPSDLALTQLAQTFVEIRNHLRAMGEEAGAPIEPPPQTKVCDATSLLPGVITCLVPGAGGYDAVACLYIDRPTVRQAITNLWSTWESPLLCPLNVHASSEGLRLEPSAPTITTTATTTTAS